MVDKTLTRMDLNEAVFREVGLSRNESADLVESVLNHISDAMVKGEQVKISSFGTFSLRDKSARVGRTQRQVMKPQSPQEEYLHFAHHICSRNAWQLEILKLFK